MKKRWSLLIGPLLYLALLLLLVHVERGVEGATIDSLPRAIWYSLVTVTSVGYGDMYPVTTAGRLIAVAFLLLSIGLLGLFLSFMVDTASRMKPFMKLRTTIGRSWYVFTEPSPTAMVFANNVAESYPDKVIIFSGKMHRDDAPENALFINASVHEILRHRTSVDKVRIFCMKENDGQNFVDAQALLSTGARVVCQAKFVPFHIPLGMSFFSQADSACRLYWQQHPVLKKDECIVFIGFGQLGTLLLERALEINIFALDQHVLYHVFDDGAEFLRNHRSMHQIVSLNVIDPARDSLVFHAEPWNADPVLLEQADRIILCADQDLDRLETMHTLRKYFHVAGDVYIYGVDVCGEAISFGMARDILVPAYVTQDQLSTIARFKHEHYRETVNMSLPAWENLDCMTQDLNLVAADHLVIKARVLLGSEVPAISSADLDIRTLRRAASVFRSCHGEAREKLRRLEHLRCLRFYYLNNWKYGALISDIDRRHFMLGPYEDMPHEVQKGHDQAWELIEAIATFGKVPD